LLIKLADTVRYAQRIRWIGYILRLDKEKMVKRITRVETTCSKKD